MDSSITIHTPTRRVTGPVLAHGLIALGMHMAEHSLPAYVTLHMPDYLGEPIRVHVFRDDLQAWAGSIEIDDVENRPRSNGETYPYSRHHLGRLPNSGVRVDVYQLLTAVPLQAVRS